LNDLIASATAVAREVFGGSITYSSGSWEELDWSGLDYVGVDYYMDAGNRSTYVDDLRAYHQHGKPIVITEFGCCCYEGAEDAGGSGFDIVDWEKSPPELKGDFVRNEQVQADYIANLIEIYEGEGVHGAFVYTFLEESPHSPDPGTIWTWPVSGSSRFIPKSPKSRMRRPVIGNPSWPSMRSPGSTVQVEIEVRPSLSEPSLGNARAC
jgi:hypothetical protein